MRLDRKNIFVPDEEIYEFVLETDKLRMAFTFLLYYY